MKINRDIETSSCLTCMWDMVRLPLASSSVIFLMTITSLESSSEKKLPLISWNFAFKWRRLYHSLESTRRLMTLTSWTARSRSTRKSFRSLSRSSTTIINRSWRDNSRRTRNRRMVQLPWITTKENSTLNTDKINLSWRRSRKSIQTMDCTKLCEWELTMKPN